MRKMRFGFLLFIIFACNGKPTSLSNEDAVLTLKNSFAENFRLTEKTNGCILEILDPTSNKVELSQFIPSDKKHKIISLSSTLNGMLSILNSTDHLVGIAKEHHVFDPEIRRKLNSGEIIAFGDESSYSLEKIISSEADIILYSGFGNEFPHAKKLRALGFILVPVYDWKEKHPLGKAEWIKMVGALVDKLDEAGTFFETTKISYEAYRSNAQKATHQPSVIAGNTFSGIWYAPAGESYMAQLIRDAGGKYRYSDSKGTGSLEFSMEQILLDNKSTEIWINPGFDSKEKVLNANPHARHLLAFKQLYDYSPNMNKFWERSAAEPHLVLSDLIHIFHPELNPNYKFHFYRKIDR